MPTDYQQLAEMVRASGVTTPSQCEILGMVVMMGRPIPLDPVNYQNVAIAVKSSGVTTWAQLEELFKVIVADIPGGGAPTWEPPQEGGGTPTPPAPEPPPPTPPTPPPPTTNALLESFTKKSVLSETVVASGSFGWADVAPCMGFEFAAAQQHKYVRFFVNQHQAGSAIKLELWQGSGTPGSGYWYPTAPTPVAVTYSLVNSFPLSTGVWTEVVFELSSPYTFAAHTPYLIAINTDPEPPTDDSGAGSYGYGTTIDTDGYASVLGSVTSFTGVGGKPTDPVIYCPFIPKRMYYTGVPGVFWDVIPGGILICGAYVP